MRCVLCESLSLKHVCKPCQELYLTPSLHKRRLDNGIEVFSFYKYADVKILLHTKHTDIGYHIYNILAKNSFKKFANEFKMEGSLASLAIDDKVESGYSHTAILNKSLKSKNIKPLHNKIRALSSVSYSGKSKEFRLVNPRNFQINEFDERDVILVDDIVTTGSTFEQAISELNKQNKEVIFCLTLCDASVK